MRQSTNETMAPRAGERLAKNINSLECLTGANVASEPKGLFGTLPNRTGASTPQARSPAADQDHGASQEDRLGGPIEQINTQATKNHQHNISGIVLHQFQRTAVEQIEGELAAGSAKVLVVAPTGAGKTVIASDLIKRVVAKHKRVLFFAHRREIIQQTSRRLHRNGVSHGIIMAGADGGLRPQAPVQVASIDTLRARALNRDVIPLPLADIIFIDEAHHARALTYGRLIDAYPKAAVIGLTATPCRGDGRGLGNIFTKLIECPQVDEMIGFGVLVRSRVYAPVDPDLTGVRTQNGDYVINQLASRMNTDELVGDIVTHWLRYGERRRTVVFAVDVAHSVHIRNEMSCAGVRAEHLDANTPISEREAILARLASGETELVTNCMILTEGWDMPEVGCCILARPTKQMGLYRQMIGRVLRAAERKQDAIILDHSGACYRHGLPEDHVEWTLLVDRRAINPAHEKRKVRAEFRLSECPACNALMALPPCGHCGWLPKPRARDVEVVDGELGLVTGGRTQAPFYDTATCVRWHGMLAFIARDRGYKSGWTAHKYREKFGSYPPWGAVVEPITPSPEVYSWVRSRQIAFAKARDRGTV
jgi:DNA repair protein RadD